MKDYYRILDITPQATPDEIKRAYRQMAMKYHPDRNHEPDAHERFVEINEAYEVLHDDSKRAAYDRARTSPFARRTGGPAYGPGPFDDWASQGRRQGHTYAGMSYEEFEQFMARAFEEMQRMQPQQGQRIYTLHLGCSRYFWMFAGALVIIAGFGMVRRSLLWGILMLAFGAYLMRKGLVSPR